MCKKKKETIKNIKKNYLLKKNNSKIENNFLIILELNQYSKKSEKHSQMIQKIAKESHRIGSGELAVYLYCTV